MRLKCVANAGFRALERPLYAMGIISTVKFAATFAFALPVALYGVNRVTAGHTTGWAFVAIALLMLAAERYITTPFDLPERAAEEAAATVADDDED